jgi:hypothetical protein
MPKTGFPTPTEPKKSTHTLRNPWDFSCPCYDERTSNFINAGTHQGVGKKQPIGHEGTPKSRVDVLPYGRKHDTLSDDEEG